TETLTKQKPLARRAPGADSEQISGLPLHPAPRSDHSSETAMGDAHCCRFLEILFAIILPPLGVFLRFGCCSMEFCICLLLTILGYVPGIIYAIYVLVALDSDRHEREYYTLA
ncbi:unnamed protein product, partial [Urochloa humidicola]